MPTFVTHALIGYLLFDFKGMIIALIPDFVSFIYLIIRLSYKYNTINFLKIAHYADPKELTDTDYLLYDSAHSLILWIILLYFFKDKAIYAAIFAIIMDIFLHSNKKWKGPAFLYPISDYRLDAISGSSPKGRVIIFTILIVVLILPKKTKKKIIDMLYIPK